MVNVEFPLLCEDWVHRVGRTGRAGERGTAVTFFSWDGARTHTGAQPLGPTVANQMIFVSDHARRRPQTCPRAQAYSGHVLRRDSTGVRRHCREGPDLAICTCAAGRGPLRLLRATTTTFACLRGAAHDGVRCITRPKHVRVARRPHRGFPERRTRSECLVEGRAEMKDRCPNGQKLPLTNYAGKFKIRNELLCYRSSHLSNLSRLQTLQ